MAQSLLLVCRQAPWSGLAAREMLDIALAGGAFDLPLALLFLDDGVFQLAPGQRAAALHQKDVTANLQALPMFGVERLLACERSLHERGLASATLTLPCERLEDSELAALFDQFDQVMTL